MATKTKLPTPAPRVPVRRLLMLGLLILGATAFGLLLSGSVWVAVAVGVPVALVGLAVHMVRRVKRVRSLLRSRAVPSGFAAVGRSVGGGLLGRVTGRGRSDHRSAGRTAGLLGRLRGAGPWSGGRRPVGQAVRSRLAKLTGRSGRSGAVGRRSATGRIDPTAQVRPGRAPVGGTAKQGPRTKTGRVLAAVGLGGRSGRSAKRSGSRSGGPTGRGGRSGRSVGGRQMTGRRSRRWTRSAAAVGSSIPFGFEAPTGRGGRSGGRRTGRQVAWDQTRQFFRDYRLSWADQAEIERQMEDSERPRVPVEVIEPMAPDYGPEFLGDNEGLTDVELTEAERDELLDAEYAELAEAHRRAGSTAGAYELMNNEDKAARRGRREKAPVSRVGTGRTEGARSMFGFQEVAGRIARWAPEKLTDTEKMLKDYPMELAEVAKAVEALASRFASEYPYDEKVVAAFAATAKGLRMSAQMSETLAKDFRAKHQADFARHEEPRRNEKHMNVD